MESWARFLSGIIIWLQIFSGVLYVGSGKIAFGTVWILYALGNIIIFFFLKGSV